MPTRTAAARREDAKHEYNAYLAGCPSRQLLERISDKWVALVLAALGERLAEHEESAAERRSMRFSELSRQVAGASQKMLTQTLRSLERDGLVERTVVPTVPATVTYELTDLGVSLQSLMRELKRWAEDNMSAVLGHRSAHDAKRTLVDTVGTDGASSRSEYPPAR